MNKASATNSFLNISHTLYVIVDAKARCSILYSSGNIQIKAVGFQRIPPPFSYIKFVKVSASRGLIQLKKQQNTQTTIPSIECR